MDELIVPALCIAGLAWLGFRAAAHDAAHGLAYWQPQRIRIVGVGLTFVGVWLFITLGVIWTEGRAVPPAVDPPHLGSAE